MAEVWEQFGAPLHKLTIMGVGLELMGIAVVWRGMSNAVAEHGGTTIGARVRKWLADFPRLRMHYAIELSGGAIGTLSVGADLTTGWSVLPADATLEERVSRFEARLNRMDEELLNTRATLRSEVGRIKTLLKAEVENRTTVQNELKERLTRVAVGDFDDELVGLVWVALGVVISSLVLMLPIHVLRRAFLQLKN